MESEVKEIVPCGLGRSSGRRDARAPSLNRRGQMLAHPTRRQATFDAMPRTSPNPFVGARRDEALGTE